MVKYTVKQIAELLVFLTDYEFGSTMTHLKLQKMLYYTQAYHLAKFGVPLFDEEFEAWLHGPVIPEIYDIYKKYGYNLIPQDNDYLKTAPDFSKELTEFFSTIYSIFGKYDGKYLEELTHDEAPWKDTYEYGKNNIISKDIMKDYYINKLQELETL